MDCSQAQTLFHSYLDGELTGSLATELAAHKLHCAACRRELALLEVAGHVVATDTNIPSLGDEFTDRLMACAMQQPVPWYRRRRVLLSIGGPLAAAACVLLTVSLTRGPAPVATDPNAPPPTFVLGGAEGSDRAETARDLLEQVEEARKLNPERRDLQELEADLHAYMSQMADNAEEGAAMLENYGKMTIMEILKSMQLDRERRAEPAPADVEQPEDEHDPPVEDL